MFPDNREIFVPFEETQFVNGKSIAHAQALAVARRIPSTERRAYRTPVAPPTGSYSQVFPPPKQLQRDSNESRMKANQIASKPTLSLPPTAF
jgi:hypothetical protein